jgi:hypothetical protein
MTGDTDRRRRSGSSSSRDRSEIPLNESRRTVDRKLEELRDIDDKAVRSVRVALVVIGFLVAGAGVVTGNGTPSVGPISWFYAGLGVFSLAISVISGIGTFTVSFPKTHLSSSERVSLLREASAEDGTPARELTAINFRWAEALEQELRTNYSFLNLTLVALVSGALFLLAAGAVIAVKANFSNLLSGLNSDIQGFVMILVGAAGAALVLLAAYLLVSRLEVRTR